MVARRPYTFFSYVSAELGAAGVMGQWPLAIGQRVAPAEQPWGPIRRDGCLRVLARTGRADCRRSCAICPPGAGSMAMSILKIEWYYCHVDIVRGALANARAARSSGCASKSVGTRKSSSYLARRLATAGLQLAAVMMMCTRIIQRCTRGAVRYHPGFVESHFFISSHSGARAQVFEMLPAFSCISWACIFAGDGAAIFFSGLIGFPSGL